MKAIVLALFIFANTASAQAWETIPESELPAVQEALDLAIEEAKFSNCTLERNTAESNVWNVIQNGKTMVHFFTQSNSIVTVKLMRNTDDQPVLAVDAKQEDHRLLSYVFTDVADSRITRLKINYTKKARVNVGTISKPKWEFREKVILFLDCR